MGSNNAPQVRKNARNAPFWVVKNKVAKVTAITNNLGKIARKLNISKNASNGSIIATFMEERMKPPARLSAPTTSQFRLIST